MCKNNCVNNQNSTKKPFGCIYLAKNILNGKVYVGKTIKSIKKRWIEHISEGRKLRRLRAKNPDKKIWGSHLNNVIAKYDKSIWILEVLDIAYSEKELNEKETFWINEYDSMNKDKGYNMTTGGEGWKKSDDVIEQIGKTLRQKYQEDAEYRKVRKRATQKGREAIQRLREEDPEFRKRLNEAIARANRKKAKDPEYIKKCKEVKKHLRKEVKDIRKFLRRIKSGVFAKNLAIEFNMSKSSVIRRTVEILGKFGIKTYTDAKEFLQDKDVNKILEDCDI